MLTWNNVLFEDKLDGYCDQCGKYTTKCGDWLVEYTTYDVGGWLGDYFYCHNCLEKMLGPMPEPVCPIDAENYNPF